MLLDAVRAEWRDRYGDVDGLSEWLDESLIREANSHGLTLAAQYAIKKFITSYESMVPAVAAEHPEFIQWCDNDGAELIQHLRDSIEVDTVGHLVDVLGLVRYLSYMLSQAESVDDQWFWLVETLAQLRNGIELAASMERPERFQLEVTIRTTALVKSQLQIGFATPTGIDPAGVRFLH